MKDKLFSKELSYIKSDSIRNSAITMINLLPDYFFEIPASSTGKYHPEFSLGDGGLVRHTKVAVKLANDLLNNECIGYSFTDIEKDLIIFSLIIHDGLKEGKIKEKYTVFNHPILIAEYVNENKDKLDLTVEELKLVIHMLQSHMGQYNTNQYSDIVLPIPNNKYERFVHMCDYLSSRKYLNVKFIDNEVGEE